MDLGGPRPVIDMVVANGPARRAVFDTGAMYTMVSITAARDLDLVREGPLPPPFDRGHGEGYASTLRGARVGAVALAPVPVLVMPLPLPDLAAIVSPNVFSGRLVRLDLGAARLQVCPRSERTTPRGPANGYSDPPFVLPSLPVTVGAETMGATLDTGSPFSLIFPTSYAQRLSLHEPMRQVGHAGTHSGERRPIYRARIRGQVRLGPIELPDPEVHLMDLASGVNVGMGLLRQMVVTLDPEAKRAWVSPRSMP